MTGGDLALPDDYHAVLVELRAAIGAARLRAHRLVNSELVGLYWRIGQTILERQAAQGWGARVIDRLADDLRSEFPEMTGFSRRNLHYMRSLAETWPTPEAVQQAAAQLPWGHVLVILDKVATRPERATGTPPGRSRAAGPGRCCATRSRAMRWVVPGQQCPTSTGT